MSCVNCGCSFEKRSKGFKRKPLFTSSRSESVVQGVLGVSMTPKMEKHMEDRFLCDHCDKLFKKAEVGEQAKKELFSKTDTCSYIGLKRNRLTPLNMDTSTPAKKMRTTTTESNLSDHGRRVTTGMVYMNRSQYKRGFRWFLKNSKAANAALLNVIASTVRKEMKTLVRDPRLPHTKDASLDAIKGLDWNQVLETTRTSAPMLYHALCGAMTKKSSAMSTLTRGYGQVSLTPVLGCLISIILSQVKPKKATLFQKMNALQMWRAGCKRTLFTDFYHIGVSVAEKSMRSTIDSITRSFDKEKMTWKSDVESYVFPCELNRPNESLIPENITNFISDGTTLKEDDDDDNNDDMWEDVSEEDDTYRFMDSDSTTMIYDTAESTKEPPKGYTLIWDDVGRHMTAQHQPRNHGNKYKIGALAFLVKNRICTTTFTDESSVNAVDISTDCFLLNRGEIEEIRGRMTAVVGEILTKHIKCYEPLQGISGERPKHRFSDESKRKSEIYSIGIIPENPSSTAGVIKILEKLHDYVPRDQNGNLYPLITWGDALSCERHCDAQNARANAASKLERLEGLEPSPQEFHKRMLLLQDTMDLLYNDKSGEEKGTLFYLKTLFNHRSFSENVTESFNHVGEFLAFVTEGYIVLFAMRILGVNLNTEIGENILEMEDNEKRDYLRTIANRVVDEIWCPISTTDSDGIEEEESQFCICKEDFDDEDEGMIKCDNNDCEKGTWFHFQCVGLKDDSISDAPWYCSTECRQAVEQYQYCSCKQYKQDEPLIECSNNTCEVQWFHGSCVGLGPEHFQDEDELWFCSQSCKKYSEGKSFKKFGKISEPDRKFEYTKALVWRGLNDMIRHEAVGRNDGRMMTLYWKMDMMSFCQRNHHKYFKLAHSLIAGLNGWLPERLRMDLIWNRTVNLTGGESANNQINLVDEFLNKEFKESTKSPGSKLTPGTLERPGKLADGLSQDLDKIYTSLVDVNKRAFTGKRKAQWLQDIELFVRSLEHEKLTEQIPGRYHQSFKNISSNVELKNVYEYREEIEKLNKKLDERRVAIN